MSSETVENETADTRRLLAIGMSTYDLSVQLEVPLEADHKYKCKVGHTSGGGPAYNAAYLCRKWGMEAYLRSYIGTDDHGRNLVDLMRVAGVREDELIIREGYQSSYSYIFIDPSDGTRTLMNFREDPRDESHTFPTREFDVILTDGIEPRLSLDAFAQYPDVPKIIDAGTLRPGILPVAEQSDYLVCSRYFAEQYSGQKIDPEDMTRCEKIFRAVESINKKTAVITIGAHGLLYRMPEDSGINRGVICRMPAHPVNAVDTTGAGDIFHGAFAYAIAHGMTLVPALELASAAAAISVERMGSQSAIPSFDEVKERTMHLPNNEAH